MNQEPRAAAASAAANPAAATTTKPTYDQMYLIERINTASEGRGILTPAAVQRLNLTYGLSVVSDALRSMRVLAGDGAQIRSPYAYLDRVCKGAQV